MNNENNKGIIIEGGITKVNISVTENSFPVELPVELVGELTIVGGTRNGKYHIPTMKGLYIFIGATDNAKHQGRIKVSANINSLERGEYYTFYYDNGEIKHKKFGNHKNLKEKDIKRIEEFYYRNMDAINASSNAMKKNDRIDAKELYKNIYDVELEYYKNGGR